LPFLLRFNHNLNILKGQLQVGTNKNSNLLKIYYLQHKTDERSLHPGHACVACLNVAYLQGAAGHHALGETGQDHHASGSRGKNSADLHALQGKKRRLD
jgi:hypothetical protein